MPVFNYPKKEVNVKVVYYGPGLSGKTTNLQKIHEGIKPDFRGKLISLATQTDRTLFFDFMPMDLGSLGGYKIRLHLYTVPGQVHYNATRKLVLKGVDGIVFVADSQKAMADANLESIMNLEKNLQSYGKTLVEIPHVIQANKRDLVEVLSLKEVESRINHHGAILTEAVASEGQGVLETLTEIVRLVMKDLRDQFSSGGARASGSSPRPAHEPAAASESESEKPELDHAQSPEPEEEVELELDPAPEPLPEVASEHAISASEVPGPEEIVEKDQDQALSPEESPSEPAPQDPVKILLPVAGVGMLELTVSIRARMLEKGVVSPVSVDLSGAAIQTSRSGPTADQTAETAAESAPEPLLDQGLDLTQDSIPGASEGKPGQASGFEPEADELPEVKLEAAPASSDGASTAAEAEMNKVVESGKTTREPYPELDIEPGNKPLSQSDVAIKSAATVDKLPPLGEPTDQPLGEPLDGENLEEMDLPDLSEAEGKIMPGDEPESAVSITETETPMEGPVLESDQAPSNGPAENHNSGGVEPLDFDFPDEAPVEKPERRGLFRRRKKK